MIFVFFCSLLRAIIRKFPDIFVRYQISGYYTVSCHLKKAVLVTGQPVTIT